jgi:hypothetical protein
VRPFLTVVSLVFIAGCQSGQTAPATMPATSTALLDVPQYVAPVRAVCVPPVGWEAKPLKVTSISEHQVWVSPGGTTAYGVMNVRHLLMPLASDERILKEFLGGMRENEGTADLLEQQPDSTLAGGLGGIRFVARGGRYTVRGSLASQGRNAWVWYAGTNTGDPVNEEELESAVAAREATKVGAK